MVALYDDPTIGYDDPGTSYDGITPPPPPPPTGETFPILIVQCAFGSSPLAETPIWTDLTGRCRAISLVRGRSFELDAVQAGTCTFTFNNLDRALDPTHAGGPYFGNLTARRLIRFGATFGGITYWRFVGFVDSWPQIASDPSRAFAEVIVTATDAFKWLGKNNLRTVAPAITNDPVFGRTNGPYKTGGQLAFQVDAEACGDRINKVLDLWPFPAWMRAIDAGNTFLAKDPQPGASETSVNYIQRITDSETGRFFVSKDGAISFQARDHWQTEPTQLHPQVVLSDEHEVGEAPYASITMDPADDRYIRNRIVRGRTDFATPFVAQDLHSITVHDELEDSKTDLLTRFKADFQAQVRWLLAKYAMPDPRFSNVAVHPRRLPAVLFPFLLAADLGTRVTGALTLVNVGDPVAGDFWIEQINEDWAPLSCEVSYALAPVDTDTY